MTSYRIICIVNVRITQERPREFEKPLQFQLEAPILEDKRQDAQSELFCASVCALAHFREETSSRFMARTYNDAGAPPPGALRHREKKKRLG